MTNSDYVCSSFSWSLGIELAGISFFSSVGIFLNEQCQGKWLYVNSNHILTYRVVSSDQTCIVGKFHLVYLISFFFSSSSLIKHKIRNITFDECDELWSGQFPLSLCSFSDTFSQPVTVLCSQDTVVNMKKHSHHSYETYHSGRP